MEVRITESFYNDREVVIKTSDEHEDAIVVEVGFTGGGHSYQATLNRAAALALVHVIREALAELEF